MINLLFPDNDSLKDISDGKHYTFLIDYFLLKSL